MEKNKSLLRINLKCNNNCIFCHSKREKINTNILNIFKNINLFYKKKRKYIRLTGGEPTINKNLKQIVSHIKNCGMNVEFITNGRMLSNFFFFSYIKKIEPSHLFISLHGSNPSIHDGITLVKNSFNQTIQGLKNIKSANIPFTIHFVMNKYNEDNLEDFLKLCIEENFNNIIIGNLIPIGNALKNLKKITNNLKHNSNILVNLLLKEKYKNLNINISGFPLCFMEELSHLNYKFHESINECYDVDEKSATFLGNDYFQKILSDCIKCKLNNICEGNYKIYIDIFGKKNSIKVIL